MVATGEPPRVLIRGYDAAVMTDNCIHSSPPREETKETLDRNKANRNPNHKHNPNETVTVTLVNP